METVPELLPSMVSWTEETIFSSLSEDKSPLGKDFESHGEFSGTRTPLLRKRPDWRLVPWGSSVLMVSSNHAEGGMCLDDNISLKGS